MDTIIQAIEDLEKERHISKEVLIEAIESPDKKFVLGVQWHPEDLLDEDMEKMMNGLAPNGEAICDQLRK